MGKTIIELVSNYINISGNSTVENILFFIIGLIPLSVAWGFVGRFFDVLGFYDSDLMSDVHWTVRVIVFLGLTWISIKVLALFTWLLSFHWWVYLIAVIIFVLIITSVYIIKYKYSKKKNKTSISALIERVSDPILDKKSYDNKAANLYADKRRKYCPRCGSFLVKRKGPYGDFFGCSSFSETGCRYTRKYL